MNSMPASNVKLWRKNWETFGSTEVGTRKYQLSKGDPQKPGKMFTIQHPKQLNIYRDPNKKTIPWPFTREEDLKAHLQTSEMTEASLLLFSRRIIFPPLMVVPTCSTDTINSHVWEVVVLLIFFFFFQFFINNQLLLTVQNTVSCSSQYVSNFDETKNLDENGKTSVLS